MDADIILEVKDISLSFGTEVVLKDLSFTVARGEFLSVLGPSGCGKTTLLRIITGLRRPDAGRIFKNGRDITDLSPDKRKIGIVFQNFALFQNMTVLRNVSYALRFRKDMRGKEKETAEEMLGRVGLSGMENKYPAELSRGQCQRVAIARTMVMEPDLILFDEPMASLDADSRLRMQEEIRKLRDSFDTTVVYVTHDQEEAFAMSDRIMVLEKGVLHQIASPDEILDHPADAYVRSFVNRNLLLHYRSLAGLFAGRKEREEGL